MSLGVNACYVALHTEENPSLKKAYYLWGYSNFPKMVTDYLDCSLLVPGDNVSLTVNAPHGEIYVLDTFPGISHFGSNVEFVSISVTKGIVKQIELVDGYPSSEYELPRLHYPCESSNEFIIRADGSVRSPKGTETVYACFNPSEPKKIQAMFDYNPTTLDATNFLLFPKTYFSWAQEC